MAIAKYGKVICEGGKSIVITEFVFTEQSSAYEALTWAKNCIEEGLREIEIARATLEEKKDEKNI